MTVRLSLALGAIWVAAVACAGESIKDLGDRDVDRSTARWDEPGATPDSPLDAGQPALDAGSDAGGPDASGAGDADVADADVDAASDASADADGSADAATLDGSLGKT